MSRIRLPALHNSLAFIYPTTLLSRHFSYCQRGQPDHVKELAALLDDD